MVTIQEITVINFGSIRFFQTLFNPKITVVETIHLSEVLATMQIVLCNKTVSFLPDEWVRSDTEIKAEVCVNEDTFYILAKADFSTSRVLVLHATDDQEHDLTHQYLSLLSHCLEQDTVENFDGSDKLIPLRLCWYRNNEDYEPLGKLPINSEYIAMTKTFRASLAKYIKTFEPEQINNKKNYKVAVKSDGRFRVFYPGINGDVFLSQTDEKLFLYVCFLNIAEFWNNIESIRNLHNVTKPLLIKNFIEYLDESAEIGNLIRRTLTLNRQVIITTLPIEKEILNKWIEDTP